MAAYYNLNTNKISKELLVNRFNLILYNQGRLVLNNQSISSLHNEPQRSPGFVSPQNTLANRSDELGQDETSTECKVSIFLKVATLFDKCSHIIYI